MHGIEQNEFDAIKLPEEAKHFYNDHLKKFRVAQGRLQYHIGEGWITLCDADEASREKIEYPKLFD